MTTDRDLLILASRAAGLDYTVDNYAAPGEFAEGWGMVAGMGKFWNTLTDDGDALRLAVKLGLFIEIDRPNQRASALPDQDDMEFSREKFGADPDAATRRAITRAASAIGEAMP